MANTRAGGLGENKHNLSQCNNSQASYSSYDFRKLATIKCNDKMQLYTSGLQTALLRHWGLQAGSLRVPTCVSL